jgi:hypothetical protein
VSKTIKRLDLLFREVQDLAAQENFYRIKAYIDNLSSNGIAGPQGPPGPAGPPGTVGVAEYAGALKITRVASVSITLGDALYAISSTHVALADASNTIAEAMVFGFALNNASPGADVDVLILGVLEDPIFSIFTVNSPLFLDEAGGITDLKRTTGYHTVIGKSLGGNQIFVSIKDPVVIA